MISVFATGCNQELLLGVAEDNPYYAIISELIHDKGRYHIETSPLIYSGHMTPYILKMKVNQRVLIEIDASDKLRTHNYFKREVKTETIMALKKFNILSQN